MIDGRAIHGAKDAVGNVSRSGYLEEVASAGSHEETLGLAMKTTSFVASSAKFDWTASSDDRDSQIADPVDMAMDLVAALHWTHPRRRPGEDDVTGLQGEQLGQVSDHFRDLPDHLV